MSLASTASTVARLTSEFGYPEHGAKSVAVRLSQLQPALAVQAERWWDTGEPIALEVSGHSVDSLKRAHGLNDIAAILTLDWLIRDPKAALAQLARGHDRVQ